MPSSPSRPSRANPSAFGTVEPLKSGRYRASYVVEGRRFRAPSTFDTADAAQLWLEGERIDRARGLWQDPRARISPERPIGSLDPFRVLCEALIGEEATYAEIHHSTLHEQERLIRRLIIPQLGEIPIKDIRASTLDAAYQRWHDDAPHQARNALVALRKIVKLGMRRDLFAFDLSDGLRTHRRPAKPIVVLDPVGLAEFRELVVAWREREARMGPQPSTLLLDVVNVILATSARIGEAVGFRVQDVTLGDDIIMTVAGKVAEGHGQPKHWEPVTKTEAGLRSVIVSEWIRPTLERLVLGASLDSTDYLFHTVTGAVQGPHAVHRQLRAVRDWAGLPEELVPHVFRKTVATTIADDPEGGLDKAAQILGQRRSRVTEQFYAKRRVLAPDVRPALDKLAPRERTSDVP